MKNCKWVDNDQTHLDYQLWNGKQFKNILLARNNPLHFSLRWTNKHNLNIFHLKSNIYKVDITWLSEEIFQN